MDQGKVIIEVENVTCRFGQVTAVEDVTLAIEEGTIFGLVGSDGAGKSTLLRTMATMIPPSSGRVIMGGLDAVTQRRQVKRLPFRAPIWQLSEAAMKVVKNISESTGVLSTLFSVVGMTAASIFLWFRPEKFSADN